MSSRGNRIIKALALAGALFLFQAHRAQGSYDSLKLKSPKHYFQTVIVTDFFHRPGKKLRDTADPVNKRLKRYGFSQFNLSFYTPLLTKNHYNADSTVIKNSHLLLTVNYTQLRPQFSGLDKQHVLTKAGIGIRYIYNTGKKGVLFADVSPFVTRDVTYATKGFVRLASTLVYSHNVSDRFNWRIGVTKSFTWGNRLYLPFVGIRIGRLDKVNLSLQFPRSLNLTVPVSPKFILSAYTMPQGGLYSFSNKDSLYFANDAFFHFTQYQLNSGLRADVRTGPHFNFYVSAGIVTRSNITFYSERGNSQRPRQPYRTYFYSENTPPTLFLNVGLLLKFGKTRSYYNDKNLYDAMDLNNTLDHNGNAQIPVPEKQKKADANLKAIQDLIDYNDF